MNAEGRRRRAVVAGHDGDVEVALELAGDPDASVRVAALGALARAGSLEAAAVLAAASDEHPTVRSRLADLLAGSTGPSGGTTSPGSTTLPGTEGAGLAGDELADVLHGLLRDEDATVVEPAAFAAGECYGMDTGVEPPTAVAAALREVASAHPDLLCREAAIAALGSWGRHEDLDVILGATTAKPALRRRAAVGLAAHLDDERAVEALRKLSGDRDWQVREIAEVLLDGIDPVTP